MSPYGKAQFERRVFPRFKLEIPITYQRDALSVPDPGAQANTVNISTGGLQLSLPEAVKVGDRLHLRMYLSDPSGPRRIEASGRVVWVEPADPGDPTQVRAGLSFDDIRDEDLKYIQQFQNLWLEQSL